jgi:predicted Zn-dependent protease
MAQAPTVPANSNAPVATASTASPVLPNEPPSVSKAMHLYWDRKYDEAVTEYNRVIQAGFNAPAGYAGLARVELKQNKVADAAAAAQKGIELGPQLAATHIALSDRSAESSTQPSPSAVIFRASRGFGVVGSFSRCAFAWIVW